MLFAQARALVIQVEGPRRALGRECTGHRRRSAYRPAVSEGCRRAAGVSRGASRRHRWVKPRRCFRATQLETSQATQSGWSAWRQPRSAHGERELDRCFLVASGGSEDSPVSWVPPPPPLLRCPLDPVQPRTRLGNQLAGLVITFASLSPQHWLVPPSPPPTSPVGFLSCSLASYVECRLLSLFLFCFVLFCFVLKCI